MVPASAPAAWPTEGVVYEDLTAFKVAVLSAAYTDNPAVKLAHSGYRWANYHCTLAAESPSGAHCTFAIFATGARLTGSQVAVKNACFVHTCTSDARQRAQTENARRACAQQLARLGAKPPKLSDLSRPAKPVVPTPANEDGKGVATPSLGLHGAGPAEPESSASSSEAVVDQFVEAPPFI
ncbi:hypothetical protein JCM10213v2_002081 [Rhodosporidiobolus nylandii]